MKALLVIFNYKAGFPFIQDLERNLKHQGIEVDVLDSDRLFLKKHNDLVQNLTLKLLAKVVDVPKIGTAFRIFVLKRFLKKQKSKYNVVSVHSCDPIYIYLATDLRNLSKNFYPMVWGSDFYRANTSLREKKRVIFDNARYIIFANPVNAFDFISYYRDYKEKSIITGFGVAKFDLIKKVKMQYTIEQLKTSFGFPSDKIIVAVGYNGTKGQQHEKLLEQVSALNHLVKDRIFLLLQMTYGLDKEYAKNVQIKAKMTGINYKIITQFLDDEETSKLRLAVDVVLNAQITDGFSSSVQEHIFARNILVVGEWLPYRPLELAKIFYYKTPLESFGKNLTEVVEQYNEVKTLTRDNPNKLYAISSWSSRIKNWVSIYKGEGSKFLFNENDMCIK